MIQYFLHVAILFLMRTIGVQGLNLYFGYAGVFAFSHVAFFGVGAYTGAILMKNGHGWGLAFLAAGLITAALSALLALSSARLRADYLGIATFGFAQIVVALMYNLNELTNGARGLAAIPRPDFLGLDMSPNVNFFLILLAFTFLVMGLIYALVRSPYGRILEAIRDDEDAARSMGIATVHWKIFAFTLGSTVVGLMGVFYGPYLSFLHPIEFAIDVLALQMVILLLGGMGTFRGPFLGSLVITLLIESLRFLNLPADAVGPLRLMLYSGIFLLVLRFFPVGLGGLWKHKKRFNQSFTRY